MNEWGKGYDEYLAELHDRNERAVHVIGIGDAYLTYWGVSDLVKLLKHIDQHYTLVRKQS